MKQNKINLNQAVQLDLFEYINSIATRTTRLNKKLSAADVTDDDLLERIKSFYRNEPHLTIQTVFEDNLYILTGSKTERNREEKGQVVYWVFNNPRLPKNPTQLQRATYYLSFPKMCDMLGYDVNDMRSAILLYMKETGGSLQEWYDKVVNILENDPTFFN